MTTTPATQTARYLRTEELYDWVLSLITEDAFDDVGGTGAVRARLDGILSQGKIEGRLSALAQTQEPQPHDVYQRRKCPEDLVEVEFVGKTSSSATAHVFYRHIVPQACACGSPDSGIHARRGHVSRHVLPDFAHEYTPVHPVPDPLIEGWQAIVDSV